MSKLNTLPIGKADNKFYILSDFGQKTQEEIAYGLKFTLTLASDDDVFCTRLLEKLRQSNIINDFENDQRNYPDSSFANKFPQGSLKIERVLINKFRYVNHNDDLYMYIVTDLKSNKKTMFMIYPATSTPMYEMRFLRYCDGLLLDAQEKILNANFSNVLLPNLMEYDSNCKDQYHIISDFGDSLTSESEYTGLLSELHKSNYIQYFDNRLENGILGPWRIERMENYPDYHIYQTTNLDSNKKRFFLIYLSSEALVYDPKQVWHFQEIFELVKKDFVKND
jgi:hypothetical protein